MPPLQQPAQSVSRNLRGLSSIRPNLLQRFLIACGATIIVFMALLAYVISYKLMSMTTQFVADDSSLLISGVIAPAVQELKDTERLSPASIAAIDTIKSSILGERIHGVKIWARDGTILYATDHDAIGKRFPSETLETVFQGKVVGTLDDLHDEENHEERKLKFPLIEIYAPLYETGTRRVIAVGEFYKDATVLMSELNFIKYFIVSSVAAVTIPMILILFAMTKRANNFAQRSQDALKIKIMEMQALAEHNDALRLEANAARMETIRSNEMLLQQIGQDLHDGPIQMLSLLMLKLTSFADKSASMPARSEAQPDNCAVVQDLTARVLKQLRDISTGLALPELEGLATADVIRLAIREHEILSATSVLSEIGEVPDDLPRSLKICVYRIVQEGLNNAFHHADGVGQRVAVRTEASRLVVTVSDMGGGKNEKVRGANRGHVPLGISGLRRRVEVFQGSLEFLTTEKGAEMRASLPVDQH